MVGARRIAAALAAALLCGPPGCGETAVDLVVAADGGAGPDSDSDSDSDSDADSDSDPPPDSVFVQIDVPDWFPEDPVCITSSFYAEMPPIGPADGYGAAYPFPDIKKPPAPHYQYSTGQPPGLAGTYYLHVTVLFHDDCAATPIPEVDWFGDSNAINIGPGTGPVYGGVIQLHL